MLTWTIVFCLVHCISVLSGNVFYTSISPYSIVIGSSAANSTMSLMMNCSKDGKFVTLLKITLSRRKFTEPTFTGIASVTPEGRPKLEPTVPSDIQSRSPNITGSIDTSQNSGTLALSMNAQGLTCTDQAEFQCSFAYLDSYQMNQTYDRTVNFTVTAVPNEVIIDKPEYYDVNENALQLRNNSVLHLGTRIKYRCTANVGSNPEGQIIWEMLSDKPSMNKFIPYIPEQSTDIVTETSRQDGCFYRRTSTMYYNLTQLDEDGISFRCRARTYLDGQRYEALSNQQYRSVTAGLCLKAGPTTQPGSDINSSTVVAIVLGLMVGVLVVLIVIISISLHRYRQLAELESQEQSRAHTYVGLTETRQTSEPYAVLNVIPADSHCHPYCRVLELNCTASTIVLEDGNVRLEESSYVDMANNEL